MNFQQRSMPRQSMIAGISNQRGAALVITLVVLTVLTLVALASTDSNQIQAAMVRNNQFRLEAFNASYTEIDAQVDKINTNPSISAGIPKALAVLIDKEVDEIRHDDTDPLIFVESSHPEMTQGIASRYARSCVRVGGQVDVVNKLISCHVLQLESEAQYQNTKIRSDQFQNYEYDTFKKS